jgi:hypothetical protein
VDWAWKPLVFYDPGGHELGALVRQQAVFNLNAAVALWNRARVDLNLPLPIASGDDVRILDRSYGAPEGGGLGDVRLGADVRIFGAPHGRLTGAVGAQLFVPTGRNRSFSGDGGLRFWPRFMLAGERGRLVWAARAGVHLRPGDACGCDLAPGSELTLGGAVGWQLRPRLLLGAELYGSAALSGGGAFAGAAPPAELLLGGQLALKPRWRINAGIAPGLTDGPGSPGLRAVVGLQFDVGAPAQAPSPVPTAVPPWTATPAGP